jgi:hypothetical protein
VDWKGVSWSAKKASIAGKFDGYSEAWARRSYPVKKLKDLMDLVRASED